MARKFFTYESTPTCTTAACSAGEVLTPALTKLLTGVRGGETVRLVSVTMIDYEDIGSNVGIQFCMKNTGGAVGVGGANPNITDSNLRLNVPLGVCEVRGATDNGGGDMENSKISTNTIDLLLTSDDDAVEGEIYYSCIASEAIDLAAASSYTFRFGFEIF